ncbi:trans-sulfuration enzyme family protein [Humidisolicoccus flavus]|uniref:trans-sulfuration enzyme family protein n=1 Tax=Humidisolicoccus flavus TaxID=3111414 RepID=UPI00324910CD
MSERATSKDTRSLNFSSQAVHAGNPVDAGSGAIRQPIVMANSYLLPEDPSQISWSGTDVPLYTRNSGANQLALQDKLAVLEGGESAIALASGVAALHAVFFSHLRSGDHVVVADATYEATWRLFSELLPNKYGITATFVDITDHDAVAAAFTSATKLLVTEVIANPTTTVAHIPALARIAHERGALLVVDSTFTPPPLYRPLEHGADLVVHSLTKFINGHGDAMGGAVIGSDALLAPIREDAMVDVGGVISPFNAWLIARGAVTLPLRLPQHLRSADRIAAWLESRDEVAYVAHPSLESHPQHEVAAELFNGAGSGAVLAFALDGPPELQNAFVAKLRLITSAVSLGHDETLIVHVGTEGPRVAAYPSPFREFGHLRLSVGLEDAEDLIADLEQAFAAVRNSIR